MKDLWNIVFLGAVVLLQGCAHTGTILGAGAGASIDDKHPVRGAIVGGVLGSIVDDNARREGYYGDRRVRGQGGQRVMRHNTPYHNGLRIQPCQPFHATAMMDWAKGAGKNIEHSRTASVSNNGGELHCYMSESASSSLSSVPRYQPRYEEPSRYQYYDYDRDRGYRREWRR